MCEQDSMCSYIHTSSVCTLGTCLLLKEHPTISRTRHTYIRTCKACTCLVALCRNALHLGFTYDKPHFHYYIHVQYSHWSLNVLLYLGRGTCTSSTMVSPSLEDLNCQDIHVHVHVYIYGCTSTKHTVL